MHSNLKIFYALLVITAATAVVYLFQGPTGELTEQEGANFGIDDTSAVTQIFIADMDGNEVTLTRPEQGKLWNLNGRYKAREDAVNLLLKTFLRASVQGPVAEAARPNVIRLLSARGKKVEIYQGGDKPTKTWYVGTATPSHTGTYMVLETPQGRGQVPYVVHMEGFTGYLSTRFFTSEREWRYTGVFDFPGRSLRRIRATFRDDPLSSYALIATPSGSLVMEDGDGGLLPYRDTIAVQDHFLRFKKTHLETFRSRLEVAVEDSLRTTPPAIILQAEGTDGRISSIGIHWKPRTGLDRDENGNLMEHDGEQLYGVTNRGEVVLLQRFVFDPLIRPRAELQLAQVPPVASAGLPMPTN